MLKKNTQHNVSTGCWLLRVLLRVAGFTGFNVQRVGVGVGDVTLVLV